MQIPSKVGVHNTYLYQAVTYVEYKERERMLYCSSFFFKWILHDMDTDF